MATGERHLFLTSAFHCFTQPGASFKTLALFPRIRPLEQGLSIWKPTAEEPWAARRLELLNQRPYVNGSAATRSSVPLRGSAWLLCWARMLATTGTAGRMRLTICTLFLGAPLQPLPTIPHF